MANGTYHQLRDNLYDLLKTVTSLQEVHKNPTLEFNGYPGAFILPMGNEADYLTNIENKRLYTFNVWLVQEYDAAGIEAAYNALLEVIDDVLNVIDAQDSPDSARAMANGLGAAYTLITVRPTVGEMQRDQNEKQIFLNIMVRCYVTVDLTVI